MKSVLTIQSQVVGALVGNSVAGFALQRLGVPTLAIPTTLLGRRPDRGPPGGGPLPAGFLTSLLDALEGDNLLDGVEAVLSGYLALPEQADFVLDAVSRVKARNPNATYICDPVLGDVGGQFVSTEVAQAIIEKLIPEADILTPNVFELGLITKARLQTLESVHAAARALNKRVIVTSATTDKGSGALYVAPGGSWLVQCPTLPDAPKGTGDLFTALFVARRMRGQSVVVSLEAAVGATYDVIMHSRMSGSPHLAVVDAQEKLEHPVTWPNAQPYEG
jgi:pyridoxine kinase